MAQQIQNWIVSLPRLAKAQRSVHLLVSATLICVLGRHHGDEVNQSLHLVVREAVARRQRCLSTWLRYTSQLMAWLHADLLVQKLLVLGLELLDDILVVKQLFDRAVRFAQQILDGGTTMLAVGLPEVAIQESVVQKQEGVS